MELLYATLETRESNERFDVLILASIGFYNPPISPLWVCAGFLEKVDAAFEARDSRDSNYSDNL